MNSKWTDKDMSFYTNDSDIKQNCGSELAVSSTLVSSVLDVSRQSEMLSLSDLKRMAHGFSIQDSGGKKRLKIWDKTCGPRGAAYKNLFGLSVSFMIAFSAYLGLQNLQAAFNGNLGLYSLIVLFSSSVLSSFMTPTVIRLAGTKYSLLSGYIAFLIYTLTNYYPELPSLIPGSLLLGVSFAPMWASLYTHITTIAITYAPALKEKYKYLVPRFAGILSFHVQFSQIVGNTVSSVIFMGGASTITPDADPSPANICNNTVSIELPVVYHHALKSVYVLFDVMAIIILCATVDNVCTETRFLSKAQVFREYFKSPIVMLMRVLLHWKSFLILPLSLLNGMVLAFVSSALAQDFVSRCIGVQWVGFVIVSYGISSAVFSVLVGRIVKHIPVYFIIYTALTINLTLVLFTIFWELRPSYPVVFLFAVVWGLSVGVWMTMIPGITGLLFPDRQEAAFTVYRIWVAVGFVAGFITAAKLEVEQRMWFYVAVILVGFVTYTILILLTMKKKELLPCCFRESETVAKGNNEQIEMK